MWFLCPEMYPWLYPSTRPLRQREATLPRGQAGRPHGGPLGEVLFAWTPGQLQGPAVPGPRAGPPLRRCPCTQAPAPSHCGEPHELRGTLTLPSLQRPSDLPPTPVLGLGPSMAPLQSPRVSAARVCTPGPRDAAGIWDSFPDWSGWRASWSGTSALHGPQGYMVPREIIAGRPPSPRPRPLALLPDGVHEPLSFSLGFASPPLDSGVRDTGVAGHQEAANCLTQSLWPLGMEPSPGALGTMPGLGATEEQHSLCWQLGDQ